MRRMWQRYAARPQRQRRAGSQGGDGGKGRNLLIEVAPDSGTGDLRGINDALAIAVRDDVHCYDFAYTLPAAH